jgi:hypothetical protein
MGVFLEKIQMLKKLLAIVCMVLVLLFIMWEGYSCWLWFKYRNLVLPYTFGNFEHNIATVETSWKTKDEIRFAVVGDWRGFGTLDNLIASDLDFLILLGDISRNPTDGHHKFLQVQMATEVLTDYPIFYVPGNHDVGSSYTLEKWQQTYGPSQFIFKLDGNLFIFTYLIGSEAGLDYLEQNLYRHAHSAKRIFVFNHMPPDLGFNWVARVLPYQERLMKLLDTYRVDYFIGGDYHGYARVQKGATAFIISGGGGAGLEEEIGNFHSAMLFTIKDEKVQEGLCALSSNQDPLDKFESIIFSEFIPFVSTHRLTLVVINIACLAAGFMAVRNFCRYLYRKCFLGKSTWNGFPLAPKKY